MRKYVEASNAMFEICERYTPLVERVSVDEGYLDVTPEDGASHCRTHPGRDQGGRSESRSRQAFLTANTSPKSPRKKPKPDGLGVVGPDEALEFLKDLPVGKIPGVGPKTAKLLEAPGIRTAGDPCRSRPATWRQAWEARARLVELPTE